MRLPFPERAQRVEARRVLSPAARSATVVLAAALLLSGCTAEGPLLNDYNNGSGSYVSGDGSIVIIAADRRAAAVEFSGETDTGERVDSADLAGRVVLLNFWYAACPPCRLEAPILQGIADQETEVVVLGVNVRDSAETARTFAREHGVEYPSILDSASNDVQYAFSGDVPPNAVPTTLLLDKQGRVAARFSGGLQDDSAVLTQIAELQAE